MLKDDPLYHPRRKAAWYKRTRKHNLERMRQWRRVTHAKAIATLGGHCVCCSESTESMLDIDHVHGEGRRDSLSFNGNNFKVYQRITSGEADRSNYQVLCCNCNQSKRRNRGLCEHYTSRWSAWFFSDEPIPDPRHA